MIDYISNWLSQVKNTYGVNPFIFGAVYCIGIIPFWFSLYKITAGFRKKDFKQVRVFAILLGVVIIAPFTYVAVWGHNLPFWFWIIALALICYSVYSVVQKLKAARK